MFLIHLASQSNVFSERFEPIPHGTLDLLIYRRGAFSSFTSFTYRSFLYFDFLIISFLPVLLHYFTQAAWAAIFFRACWLDFGPIICLAGLIFLFFSSWIPSASHMWHLAAYITFFFLLPLQDFLFFVTLFHFLSIFHVLRDCISLFPPFVRTSLSLRDFLLSSYFFSFSFSF